MLGTLCAAARAVQSARLRWQALQVVDAFFRTVTLWEAGLCTRMCCSAGVFSLRGVLCVAQYSISATALTGATKPCPCLRAVSESAACLCSPSLAYSRCQTHLSRSGVRRRRSFRGHLPKAGCDPDASKVIDAAGVSEYSELFELEVVYMPASSSGKISLLQARRMCKALQGASTVEESLAPTSATAASQDCSNLR